jgi:hypothetical protein
MKAGAKMSVTVTTARFVRDMLITFEAETKIWLAVPGRKHAQR